MVKVNRKKPQKNTKYDMNTTLIGRDQLEISKMALELLWNPDESCTCLKWKRKEQGTKNNLSL